MPSTITWKVALCNKLQTPPPLNNNKLANQPTQIHGETKCCWYHFSMHFLLQRETYITREVLVQRAGHCYECVTVGFSQPNILQMESNTLDESIFRHLVDVNAVGCLEVKH